MWVRSALALLPLLAGISYSSSSLGQYIYEPLEDGGRNNLIKVAIETEELTAPRIG